MDQHDLASNNFEEEDKTSIVEISSSSVNFPSREELPSYKLWKIVQALIDIFTPLDRFYQRLGNILFHWGRNFLFNYFLGNFDSDLICLIPRLILLLIAVILIVSFQFLNLHQALIRGVLKKLLGDATPPSLLWKYCLFASMRDKPFE